MDIGPRDRGELSIPSFASQRCRALTANLARALEEIPPLDDEALEDRALACFLVACGELGLMSSTTHRDEVVEQLTVVARKLVKANAESSKPKAPKNQAQALAEVLMRGVVRGAARIASKGPSLQPAQRPILDISVDPPAISARGETKQTAEENTADPDAPPHEARPAEANEAAAVQAGAVQAETAQPEPAGTVQANPADAGQEGTAQKETVQAKTIEIQSREEKATPGQATEVEVAQASAESPAALSWDELESLMKKEVVEIASHQ
jgi:hypothetical protein